MDKLKIIAAFMVIVGFVSFIVGIVLAVRELAEFGLYIGVAGVIGYSVVFILSSTSKMDQKSNSG